MTDDKKPPLQSLRDGSLKINSFKGQDGNWRNSKSFTQDDIIKLQPLLVEAQQQMEKWQDYYKEVEKQQNPDLPNPVQQQKQPPQQKDMAAQRDAVMSKAKPEMHSQNHEKMHKNVQSKSHER